jgi:hypothetical protein
LHSPAIPIEAEKTTLSYPIPSVGGATWYSKTK